MVIEEQFNFSSAIKRKVFTLIAIGAILAVIGVIGLKCTGGVALIMQVNLVLELQHWLQIIMKEDMRQLLMERLLILMHILKVMELIMITHSKELFALIKIVISLIKFPSKIFAFPSCNPGKSLAVEVASV